MLSWACTLPAVHTVLAVLYRGTVHIYIHMDCVRRVAYETYRVYRVAHGTDRRRKVAYENDRLRRVAYRHYSPVCSTWPYPISFVALTVHVLILAAHLT